MKRKANRNMRTSRFRERLVNPVGLEVEGKCWGSNLWRPRPLRSKITREGKCQAARTRPSLPPTKTHLVPPFVRIPSEFVSLGKGVWGTVFGPNQWGRVYVGFTFRDSRSTKCIPAKVQFIFLGSKRPLIIL